MSIIEADVELPAIAEVNEGDVVKRENEEPSGHKDAVHDELPLPAVQVCVRLRPLLTWEKSDSLASTAIQLEEGKSGAVTLRPPSTSSNGQEAAGSARRRAFRFDAVVGPDSSQQSAWDAFGIDRVIDKVANGFHGTVFAYGQTGTGKTHTMEGFAYDHHNGSSAPSAAAARPKVQVRKTDSEQFGVVPRAIQSLFSHVESIRAKAEARVAGTGMGACVVRVSFLQIYNEKIFDLLNPALTPSQREAGGRGEDFNGLRLRWDAAKRQFFVENQFEYECTTVDEVLQHYSNGIQNKQVASTAMNVASSRSHTLLVLTLVRRHGLVEAADSDKPADMLPPVQEVISKLSLVDLAGSERTSANSGFDKSATRFHEAINVNQSLFVLRKVITALSKRSEKSQGAESQSHIPYRESKLTSLLQHALGGNSYLVMLACLSPADRHFDENLSTLHYASQAASIKNQPAVNLDPKDRLIKQLEARLSASHAFILELLGTSELPSALLEAEDAAALATGGKLMKSSFDKSRPRPAQASSSRAPRPTSRTPVIDEEASKSPFAGASGSAGSSKRSSSRRPAYAENVPSDGLTDSSSLASNQRPAYRNRSPRRSEEFDLFAAADALLAEYDSDATRGCAAKPVLRSSSTTSPRELKRSLRPPSLPPSFPTPRSGLPSIFGRTPTTAAKVAAFVATASPATTTSSHRSTSKEEPPPTIQEDQSPHQSSSSVRLSEVSSNAALLATTAAAVDNGLLDAIEELKEAKDTLEVKLLSSERLVESLQASLVSAKEQLESRSNELAAQLESLKVEAEEKIPAEPLPDFEAMGSENTSLKKELAVMKEKLEVFYKAIELTTPLSDANQEVSVPPDLANKVEKLHSQLVLESVSLQNEVSRLKKKKWILQAVLDNGGENERRAIDEEVEQLRRSKLGFNKTVPANVRPKT